MVPFPIVGPTVGTLPDGCFERQEILEIPHLESPTKIHDSQDGQQLRSLLRYDHVGHLDCLVASIALLPPLIVNYRLRGSRAQTRVASSRFFRSSNSARFHNEPIDAVVSRIEQNFDAGFCRKPEGLLFLPRSNEWGATKKSTTNRA